MLLDYVKKVHISSTFASVLQNACFASPMSRVRVSRLMRGGVGLQIDYCGIYKSHSNSQ